MEAFLANFAQQVAEQPTYAALEDEGLALSYADLDAASDRVAGALQARGLKENDRIGYLGLSIGHRVVALLGALKAGVGLVVLNGRDPIAAINDIAVHAGLAALLIGPGGEEKAQAIDTPAIDVSEMVGGAAPAPTFTPRKVDPDALAYILYTSGSTGRPKGVPVSRSTAWHQTQKEATYCDHRPDARVALFGQVWIPMLLQTLNVGATLVCYDFAGRGVGPLSQWLRDERISLIESYPAMFREMAAATSSVLPDADQIYLIGEALGKDDVIAFERICPPTARLISAYGSTECICMAYYVHRHGDRFELATVPMGRPLEPEKLRLVGDDGADAPIGEVGQLVLTSEFAPPGYFNDPERSTDVLTPLGDGRTEYRTGDYAFMDSAGVLHSVGRADDQIKVRGYTLRGSEVEQEIQSYPGVKQAVATTCAGPRGIRQLACHFEEEPDAAVDIVELKRFLGSRLPAYMTPSHFVRHDALPRTRTGKPARARLPNPLAGRDAAPAPTEFDGAEADIADIWRDILGVDDFGREDDFFDVGGDSLQAMTMVLAIERRFGLRVPLESLILESATVAGLAKQARAADLAPAAASAPTAMNRGGPERPLFALHTAGGHLSDYLPLAHALDGVRPVLGVGPRGLAAHTAPDADIDRIASHAADVIGQAAGSDAPRLLIGFSAAAPFAYETARHLIEAGEPPPTLVLIDARCSWLNRLRWLQAAWRATKGGDVTAGMRRALDGLAPTAAAPENIDDAHLTALLAHRPEPLALPHALLIVGEQGLAAPADAAEWRRLLGPGLTTIEAPGDHMSMIRRPFIGALAQRLNDWLANG